MRTETKCLFAGCILAWLLYGGSTVALDIELPKVQAAESRCLQTISYAALPDSNPSKFIATCDADALKQHADNNGLLFSEQSLVVSAADGYYRYGMIKNASIWILFIYALPWAIRQIWLFMKFIWNTVRNIARGFMRVARKISFWIRTIWHGLTPSH